MIFSTTSYGKIENVVLPDLFSVQYATHLLGYLKEWRKNPQWSFSCFLALFLPLIDLSGDIGGLVETNVINTQLDTGQMEMTTITDTVKDSGAFNVTVEEGAHREAWENIDRVEEFCNKKRQKATQTELTTYYSSVDVGEQKTLEKTC